MLHLQSICRKMTLTKVDATFTKGLCKKTQIKHLFTNFADRPSKKRGMPDGRTHTRTEGTHRTCGNDRQPDKKEEK